MPLPPITPAKVHDIAESAMQGLLSSDAARQSVYVTSKSKKITFNQELAIEAYDIAEAMIAESVVRL
jgi:hypothetical protein